MNDWTGVLQTLRGALASAVKERPDSLAVAFSPWMTCEEAFLLATYMKSLSPSIRLFLGPVPVVGEDDRYPKGIDGRPTEPATFIIRAEKCPNRAGITEILKHFAGELHGFDELKSLVAEGRVTGLYAVGGYRQPWLTEADRDWLSKLKLLVVQDMFPSPASELAHIVLPGGSFAEKDGTFVNHAGLAQMIQRSLRSPGEARADGRILWELSGRRGLFHAPTVRAEIGSQIQALAALSTGDLGPAGRLLSDGRPQQQSTASSVSQRPAVGV